MDKNKNIAIGNYLSDIPTLLDITIAKWKKRNPIEKIRKQTLKILNNHKEAIILNFLGFNNFSGGWKMNCKYDSNAASRDAIEYFRQSSQEAIMEWFDSLKLPEISEELKKESIAKYAKEYRHQFKLQMQRKIELQVKLDVAEYITNTKKEIQETIERHTQFTNLLRENTNGN